MKEYKASTGRELNKLTIYIAVVMGLALIALAFYQHSPYAAAIGIVLIAAVSFNKTFKVTEEGVIAEYSSFFSKKREVWRWDEIMEIHCEYSDKQPGKVGLHFTKESLLARRLLFRRDIGYEVVDLALAQNPEIRVTGEE